MDRVTSEVGVSVYSSVSNQIPLNWASGLAVLLSSSSIRVLNGAVVSAAACTGLGVEHVAVNQIKPLP